MDPTNIFKPLRLADIASDYPLTYVDVGLRDGFQDDLAPLIAMAFGYFDHALSLLEREEVSFELKSQYNVDAVVLVQQAS